jgi:Tol biopolymer transport system component
MSDLQSRFQAFDELRLPRQLERIDQIHPRPPLPESPRHIHRIAVAVFALGVSIVATALLVRTFNKSPVPIDQPSPTLHITTGAIPPHGSIVFDEFSGSSRSELAYIVRGVSGSTPMTDAHSARLVARGAAWSPDGSRISFVVGRSDSWRYTGDGDLYVMNADGSDLQQLTHGIGVTSPTWSPDGAHLAFVRDQGSALCTIDADGSGLEVIASARHYYQLPRWSPSGDVIAFQSDTKDMDHTAVFTIRPDGTHLSRLTPVGTGYPSWSPDGRQLAYRSGDRLMLLVEVSTGRTRPLTTRPLTTCSLPSCVADFYPAWSPSGTQIAFIRQEDGGAATHLYILDLASGHVRRLGGMDTSQAAPAWRP